VRFRFSNVDHVNYEGSPGALRILQAAKTVFVREGGTGFSARAVAKEAGVTLGAVQHFFRTSNQLLVAVLEFVVNEFETAYEDTSDKLPFNGEARLLAVIDILLDSNWQTDTRKLFYGIYALSCYNEFAATLLDQMYTRHTRLLAGLIGGARPRLSERRCFELAILLASMIDGAMVYTGNRKKPLIARRTLAGLVKTEFLRNLDAPEGRRDSSIGVARTSKVPVRTAARVSRI
jgi:AcrR family transcriptional regulator